MATQPSKGEMLDRLAQKATEYLKLSGNCAQTSFLVLQEEFKLDDGTILKALTPFPGIALRGETCGAVIGCLMALGLVYGREKLDDWAGYFASLPSARRFCRRFEKENGSTMCGDILETQLGRRFNLADPAEAEEYLAAGGSECCAAVVSNAVRITAEEILKKT